MLELTQNNCVICLENSYTNNPLIHKSSDFGCNCKVYFHNNCWILYLNRDNKCPYCRIIRPLPYNLPNENPQPDPSFLYRLVRKYNIFLLLAQILIAPCCVLYTIGLTELHYSDSHFLDIIVISSTAFFDFIICLITDCNTSLLLNNKFRKLFLFFNVYKFLMCIVSVIMLGLGELNKYEYTIYGTIFYTGSYCLLILILVITCIFTN
jgi:hypothetical protein